MIEYTSKNVRLWSRLGSCGAFGAAACDLEKKMDKLVVLTADLRYYSGLERFKKKKKKKLYNCGIAEENMIGMAAGFAKEGFVPFASTYATFASMRCADQVRVNMGYMKLPIKLVGLTAGLSVGVLGATHIATEDMAVMRAIPNIDILSPADCMETIKAIQAAAQTDRPTYIRLTGTMPNPPVYKEDYEFTIGKAISLREGTDATIIATGTMVHIALNAALILAEQNIDVSVLDMHTIKPLDENAVLRAAEKCIVTVEEHSVVGGLGSAVNDCLLQHNIRGSVLNIGIADAYPHAASYEYLMKYYGLTSDNLAKQIAEKLKEISK